LELDLKPPLKKSKQRQNSSWVRKLAAVFASCVGVLMALGLATVILPKGLNPFAPLRPEDPIGPLTKWKLQGLAMDAGACRAFLTAANVSFTSVPDRSEQGFCHVKDSLRLTSGGPAFYPNAPMMTCPVAAGLIIWERHALAPAAREIMGSPVTRIEHLGTYACRRQYGRATGWVSEHASANAMDIASFTFANGQKVALLKDWNPRGGEPTQGANFLREVHNRACDVFKVVLGPEANDAHKNHFHFDMGPMMSCR
jgi:hypothetical protein